MTRYVAKRIRFRNGERHSVLSRVNGLPVHEATLFLARFRTRGRAANTIHRVCSILVLLYRWLDESGIDILERLRQGRFLTLPELYRLADIAQYRAPDVAEDRQNTVGRRQVFNLNRIRMRRSALQAESHPVGVENHATRLRYISSYLTFLTGYFAVALPSELREKLEREAKQGIAVLNEQMPRVSKRATLGAREGLSKEDQDRLVARLHPNSPDNPWKREFVRYRNWLIVVLLLATGMRRGELLNVQLSDLAQNQPKLSIVRRPDSKDDRRKLQPTPKTRERTIELHPSIMKRVWDYVAMRREITLARKHPFLMVSEEGDELGYKTIDKIFADVRRTCSDFPVSLSSHVMRHTWNERFSEEAERMQVDATIEERARNEQQGWSDSSKSSQTYTRRYAARKGREIALRLQEKLDAPET